MKAMTDAIFVYVINIVLVGLINGYIIYCQRENKRYLAKIVNTALFIA